MLSEWQKKAIKGYLPHRKDPSLGFGEYYLLDQNDKVQTVYVTNIYPYDDGTEYGLRYKATGRRVCEFADLHGALLSQLYDNKKDCRAQTHLFYGGWERLRELADKEGWDEYERD